MDPIDQFRLPTVQSLGKVTGHNADEKTALRAFDAYFLGEMLRRSSSQNPTGLFDGGDAGRMYQDHFYQELARLIAEKGDFGLTRSLEGHLSNDPKEIVEEASEETPRKEDGGDS